MKHPPPPVADHMRVALRCRRTGLPFVAVFATAFGKVWFDHCAREAKALRSIRRRCAGCPGTVSAVRIAAAGFAVR